MVVFERLEAMTQNDREETLPKVETNKDKTEASFEKGATPVEIEATEVYEEVHTEVAALKEDEHGVRVPGHNGHSCRVGERTPGPHSSRQPAERN
jgi:hypothetical protein